MPKHPGSRVVTTFVLDDFQQWLSHDELKIIAANPWLMSKLRDRFLDGLGWTEAAVAAVDALRTENPITLKPRAQWAQGSDGKPVITLDDPLGGGDPYYDADRR